MKVDYIVQGLAWGARLKSKRSVRTLRVAIYKSLDEDEGNSLANGVNNGRIE